MVATSWISGLSGNLFLIGSMETTYMPDSELSDLLVSDCWYFIVEWCDKQMVIPIIMKDWEFIYVLFTLANGWDAVAWHNHVDPVTSALTPKLERLLWLHRKIGTLKLNKKVDFLSICFTLTSTMCTSAGECAEMKSRRIHLYILERYQDNILMM